MRGVYVSPDGEELDLDRLPRGIIRSAYDGSCVIEREEPGESLTVQSEEPSANLNNVVRRWLAGQPVPDVRPMQFGDVSEVIELSEAANQLIRVKEAFMQYPAEIREKFRNNPLEFAQFVSDPANLEQGREWGIFAPEPPPAAKPPVGGAPAPDGGDKPA